MGHILITDPVASEVVSRLERTHRVSLGYGPQAVLWSDVRDSIEAALVRAQTIGADEIRSAPRLRIIARHGVGTDNVDLQAAADRGVWVTTTPGANARSVAEHVFALLLGVQRKIVQASAAVTSGRWSEAKAALVGTELYEKRLLLIGGGDIARLVVPIAAGFGMEVIISDPYLDARTSEALGVPNIELDDALATADIVSVHVPLTAETTHLLNARRLDLLPFGAVVINSSRGGIIDESALRERLASGRLAGAGLDVIEAERLSMSDPLAQTTGGLDLPTLLVTPHIAGQTTESLISVGHRAIDNIESALAGHRPPNAVDLTSPTKGP